MQATFTDLFHSLRYPQAFPDPRTGAGSSLQELPARRPKALTMCRPSPVLRIATMMLTSPSNSREQARHRE
jgi:hypothetical protein